MAFQEPFIIWIQTHFHPQFDLIFKFITYFGGFEGVVFLWSCFVWCISYSFGCRLILLTQFVHYWSSLWIKSVVALPRPYQTFPNVIGILHEKGFAFPSGHALNGMLYWGYLVVFCKKRWVTFLSVTVILLIGLSRIYLGVHYPTDVFGGWVLGALALWFFWRWQGSLDRYFMRFRSVAMVFWIFGAILFFTVFLILFAPSGVPPSWGLATLYLTLSVCFGWMAKSRWLMFDEGGPFLLRLVRLVVGNLVLVPVLLIFGPKETWVFAFAGFWLTFGGPLLFQLLGLTSSTRGKS